MLVRGRSFGGVEIGPLAFLNMSRNLVNPMVYGVIRSPLNITNTNERLDKMTTAPKTRRKKAAAPVEEVEAVKAAPRTRTKKAAVSKAPAKAKAKAGISKVKTTNKSGESRYGHEKNALGFVSGSDSAIIAAALVEGGASRSDIAEAAEAQIKTSSGLKTRNGTDKDVNGLVAGVLRRMVADGFEVKQSFIVVPPAEKKAAISAEKRKAARKPKK